MRRILFLAALAAGLANEARAEDRLTTFPTCAAWDEALSGPIVDQLMTWYGYNTYYGYGYGYGWGPEESVRAEAAPTADVASAPAGAASSGPGSFTGTNVQEQGVDELDFVKTDGKYIYVLNGTQLDIVRSWPAETAVKTGSVAITGSPTSLFLHGDRAIVASWVTPTWDDQQGYGYGYYYGYYGATRLTVVDLADRSEPKVIRTIDVEGSLVSGRMIDGDVYMVLNSSAPIPQAVWQVATDGLVVIPQIDWASSPEQQEIVRQQQRAILSARVKAVLAAQPDEGLLRFTDSRTGAEPTNGRLLGCGEVYHADHNAGMGLLALVHLDLDDDSAQPDASGLLGQGWTVYASEDNLYASLTTGSWWWGWNTGTQPEPGTEIHKFELRGPHGGPQYVASGHIDGWLYNQFAMSEYEGDLRVASTNADWWWGSGQTGNGSQVTVLRDDREGHLSKIGEVDGIAPGEQMYGVRFVGERGYLVTFRQVDPLHVLDLSDPKHPRVTGELQIPGYSAYLHPIDEEHLLAVGMDGDNSGRISGMKIAIFDVSDPTRPRETHKYTMGGNGWAWSEALYDHHAFTYADGKLTIPAYSNDYKMRPDGSYEYNYWSGALVLEADPDWGIWELGRVDHGDLARQLCEIRTTAEECATAYANYGYYYGYSYGYYAQMRRSVYIDDTLVTISNLGMKFSKLNRPNKLVSTVLLPPPEGQTYAYY